MFCPFASQRPLPFHDERGCPPRLVVLHYTATTRADKALEILKRRELSAHFLLGLQGHLFQMVPISRRAWHAGISSYRGVSGVNAYSVGIELVNPGPLKRKNGGWFAGNRRWMGRVVKKGHTVWAGWSHKQISSLLSLLQWLGEKEPALRGKVVGHETISPKRKIDPGPAFPWGLLADAGWPPADNCSR
ncbi:N-acetylmuramoyl-L-alanine amidase [bacterium]|nr:N-acetylmuramoyl-L-alanine amidase [bacterium]